jgi:hypothetical protein
MASEPHSCKVGSTMVCWKYAVVPRGDSIRLTLDSCGACLPLYTAPEIVHTYGSRLYLWILTSIENRGGVLRSRQCNDEDENNGETDRL